MNEKTNFTDADLGFEEDGLEATKTVAPAPTVSSERVRSDIALDNAAAHAALKASFEASAEKTQKEAEKAYIIEKKRFMLNKCKTDKQMTFVGNKLYAQFFGAVYTCLYNGIPVTVRFDGTAQKFPEFVYNWLMEKINAVANSNVPIVDIEDRTTK